ncbi:2-hydroxy-3-oxopropionate reductase [Klebsiella pneumoniae]|nr:2-hydroxy-3-oxopropionate reductase [Klebsiella pneumoniae]
MSTLPKVAVLGLGAMGHAFASNLLKNGFTVAGWNRSLARGEDLQAHGLSLHATPQQAVADAEVIISMLADGEATLEVLAQIAPACQPQAIYCQMGTIGLPETRQAIAMLRELQPAMTYSGSRRRTRDMPERICLRYISGCRRRQKRNFLPSPGKKWPWWPLILADGASIRIYRTLA